MNPILEIRQLSLWQPYASLMALNLKRNETRDRKTTYRGLLAIQAAAESTHAVTAEEYKMFLKALELGGKDEADADVIRLHPYNTYGKIVCVGNLTGCKRMIKNVLATLGQSNPLTEDEIDIQAQSPLEIMTGWWEPGRYAWETSNMQDLATPIPSRGYQVLKVLDDPAILTEINRQLALVPQGV